MNNFYKICSSWKRSWKCINVIFHGFPTRCSNQNLILYPTRVISWFPLFYLFFRGFGGETDQRKKTFPICIRVVFSELSSSQSTYNASDIYQLKVFEHTPTLWFKSWDSYYLLLCTVRWTHENLTILTNGELYISVYIRINGDSMLPKRNSTIKYSLVSKMEIMADRKHVEYFRAWNRGHLWMLIFPQCGNGINKNKTKSPLDFTWGCGKKWGNKINSYLMICALFRENFGISRTQQQEAILLKHCNTP